MHFKQGGLSDGPAARTRLQHSTQQHSKTSQHAMHALRPAPCAPHLHQLRHLGADRLVERLELPAAQRGAA